LTGYVQQKNPEASGLRVRVFRVESNRPYGLLGALIIAMLPTMLVVEKTRLESEANMRKLRYGVGSNDYTSVAVDWGSVKQPTGLIAGYQRFKPS
jgi:hypothetical protein